MLLLSQLWLSHRHSQRAYEMMTGGNGGNDSSLFRSLTSFYRDSQAYTRDRLMATNNKATALAEEELRQKVLEKFPSPPTWAVEYAKWHREKMEQLRSDPDSWKDERFLIARCLKADRQRCGDASHRLMSIPASLVTAYKSKRIFLIKWTQPADLENYLVPPTVDENDGIETIDWRIPEWLQMELGDLEEYTNIMSISSRTSFVRAQGSDTVVIVRHMARDQGKSWYNAFVKPGDPPFRIAFGHIWRMMFRPSPKVEALLQKNMDALGIKPGSYMTVQIRNVDEETPEAIENIVKSSLACSKKLLPGTQHQIVVASESQEQLEVAMDLPGWDDRILALRSSANILSLDKDLEEWRNHTAGHYYSAFVYLYMFANAKCGSYFDDVNGWWGSLISQNPVCAASMKWRPPSSVVCDKLYAARVVPDVLQGNDQQLEEGNVEGVYWEPIPEFPDWLNEYFAWHRETRAKLNEGNWQNYRYLVLRCLETDTKCGGASDRLQSFLLGLLFGSLGERLVFIHWERPAPLEEFLVPPQGSIDWRLPDWLDEKFDYDEARMLVTTSFKPVTMDSLLVTMRHQQFWPEFYDERKQENERSYEDIFHDAWVRVFEPSLPVEALTEKAMRDIGIEPGKYVSVHVRAKYMWDKTNNHEMIHNAINCASEMRPGWPIFFASDSVKVTKAAMEYGKFVGGTVVARKNPKEPLHLDRGAEFLNHGTLTKRRGFAGYSDHAASSYYDVFVDMYLLANSQCTSLGYGGYGRLGSMLSFNRTCSIDYTKNQCTWTSGKSAPDKGFIW